MQVQKPRLSAPAALRIFLGAAVLIVVAVLTIRGGGPVAEIMATAAAIGGALLSLAWKADDALGSDFKAQLSSWLNDIDPGAVEGSMNGWPVQFRRLFDQVFGSKHLSVGCFLRSSIASMIAFAFVTIMFQQAAPGALTEFLSDYRQAFGNIYLLLIFLLILGNVLPDYLSLLETRWIIGRLERATTLRRQVGWLILDAMLTGLLFVLFVAALAAAILYGDVALTKQTTALLVPIVNALPEFTVNVYFPDGTVLTLGGPAVPKDLVVAIPFWTTFFTSVWAWLYFVAHAILRAARPMRESFEIVRQVLPVEERPLRAVGLVVAFLAFAAYSVLMSLVLIITS